MILESPLSFELWHLSLNLYIDLKELSMAMEGEREYQNNMFVDCTGIFDFLGIIASKIEMVEWEIKSRYEN